MSKNKHGQWVALRSPDGDPEAIPALALLEDGTVYWDGGPGRCPFDERCHKIVKRYDWPEDEPDDAAFYRDFGPKPKPLAQSAGWLAPDGRFWPCKGWEHDYYNRALCYMVYGEYQSRLSLENRGWIKLYPDGLCCCAFRWINGARHYLPLTPEQVEALQAICFLDPESDYGRQIGQQLEYVFQEG